MRYVLLGKQSPQWLARHDERTRLAKAKLKELDIKLEAVHYTQGPYDFVDVVDAPGPEAMLAFSVWYGAQGFGQIESMPAFDAKAMAEAAKHA